MIAIDFMPRRVLLVFVAVASTAGFAAECLAGGETKDAMRHHARLTENTTRVTVLYDCDGSIDSKFKAPVVLGHNTQETISVGQRGMTYFTIETMVEKNGKPVPTVYHVVLGSRDQAGASAILFGPRDETDDDAACIRLQKGWIWVSSTKPRNWIGTAARPDGVRRVDAGRPSFETSPAVSWNPYRFVRVDYSWGGAEATEYIYHLEQKASGLERSVFYNFDKQSAGRHSAKQAQRFEYKPVQYDFFSVATGKGTLAGQRKISSDPGREKFTEYVRCRVQKITESGNKDHCQTQHDQAENNDCSPSR